MVTTNVVKVLDLVDANDPVLTGERLLDDVQDRSLLRKANPTNSILSLTGREQALVVVVGHLVPVDGESQGQQ